MRSVRPARGDLRFQAFEEGAVVGRGQADDDSGEIRVARQQPEHGLDEEVDALLLAHPAEDADAIFSRQSRLGEGFSRSAGGR